MTSDAVGPASPEELWRGSLAADLTNLGIVVGRATIDDVVTGALIVAHELQTGAIRWQVDLPTDPFDSWRTRPFGLNGPVYATRSGNDRPSYVYALDRADGSVLWRSTDTVRDNTFEGSVYATNGDLIIGDLDQVTRIRAADGTTLWTNERGCQVSNGCAPVVYAQHGYLWDRTNQGLVVTAIDLEAGTRLYSSPAFTQDGPAQQSSLRWGPTEPSMRRDWVTGLAPCRTRARAWSKNGPYPWAVLPSAAAVSGPTAASTFTPRTITSFASVPPTVQPLAPPICYPPRRRSVAWRSIARARFS